MKPSEYIRDDTDKYLADLCINMKKFYKEIDEFSVSAIQATLLSHNGRYPFGFASWSLDQAAHQLLLRDFRCDGTDGQGSLYNKIVKVKR